jgi:hypothetical protein
MTQRSAILIGLMSISISALSCGSSSPGSTTAAGVCGDLANYKSSTTTTLSFATDILPILQDSTQTGPGCANVSICHGTPPVNLYKSGGTATLGFMGAASAVKPMLLAKSINDPSMARVTPSNVGQSFLAYKISGEDALKCSNLSCTAGVTIGTITACGDPMPSQSLGMLSAANRTKILDWIAQGAND